MTNATKEQINPADEQKAKISEAVRIVREAIDTEEARLKQIVAEKENDPVMLEGETSMGYYTQMMVDPAKVAQIMLDYSYPVYKVLEEEAPQGMWNEMARMVGLENVCSVDL